MVSNGIIKVSTLSRNSEEDRHPRTHSGSLTEECISFINEKQEAVWRNKTNKREIRRQSSKQTKRETNTWFAQ